MRLRSKDGNLGLVVAVLTALPLLWILLPSQVNLPGASTQYVYGQRSCGEMPPVMGCQPALDAVVPCAVFCDAPSNYGERCVVEIRTDSDHPFAASVAVSVWWLIRSRGDNRRHYVYVDSFGTDPSGVTMQFVLCSLDCWTEIEGMGWTYRDPQPRNDAIAGVVTNDCLSCRIPTPTPRPFENRPFKCAPWLYLPVAVRPR
jgi:hypothetical protein